MNIINQNSNQENGAKKKLKHFGKRREENIMKKRKNIKKKDNKTIGIFFKLQSKSAKREAKEEGARTN